MNFIIVGSISACCTVILGAFGAHGMKDLLDAYHKSVYEKAVLYQMFHTIGIILIGILEKVIPKLKIQLVGWIFLIGIIFFSGSLYILAITEIKWIGYLTPVGGSLFITGWVIIAYKTLKI